MWMFYAIGFAFLLRLRQYWQNAESGKRILTFILIGAGTLLMVSSDQPDGTYVQEGIKVPFKVFRKEPNAEKEQQVRG